MATSTGSTSSVSSGQSTSSSVPASIQSPQTEFSLNLSQLLESLGQSQAQWASQQFANTSAITDANVNNYLAQAQQGSGLAGSLLKDYNTVFAPMQDQYAANAGSYASLGRVQNEMGRAESDAMQAGQKAKGNAEQELQGFGIDPSSGRYQDLIRASDTANAASAVGAGEAARVNTENQGQQRLLNSIQMGQQLPGAAVNSLNSAYQGIAGAENSALANAQTGVALKTSPNQFFSTAQQVKVPPVGNTSQSQSTQQARSGGTTTSGGSSPSSSGGGNGGGGLPGGGPSMGGPSSQGTYSPMGSVPPAFSGGGGGGGAGGGMKITQVGDGSTLPDDTIYDPSNTGGGVDENGFGQAYPGEGTDGGFNSYGDPTYDQSQTSQGGFDTGGFDSYNDTSGGNYLGSSDQNYNDYSGSADMGDTSSYDSSYGYGDAYAQGGAVPGGGAIPSGMSPSGGSQVDDVPAHIPQTGGRANLNVGEFVIPRDVAAWKGQEFFQKMIMQSRKARTGAPAKPQRG